LFIKEGIYMKMQRLKKILFILLFLLLLPVYQVFAVDPSPVGGGWLEVSKPGGYAFIANHDDFGKNLINEFTLEMWFYMKRAPRFGEIWVLLHKEGSYMLTLSGHILGINRLIPFDVPSVSFYITYNYPNGSTGFGAGYTMDELPPNQWHHIAYVHGENVYCLYINGEQVNGDDSTLKGLLDYTNNPFCIGGTNIDLNQYWNVKSLIQFSEGLIDEVRISDKARYPAEDKIIPIRFEVPQGRFEPDENTLALWHFDGDRAAWLKDASGHEHTLTAMNLNYYSIGSHERLPTVWGKVKGY